MQNRSLTLATVVAVLSGLVLAAPAAAQAEPIVSVRDARADVRIYAASGPTVQQRRKIDLRKFTVVERGAKLRFTVKIAAITTSKKFQQMAFVRLTPAVGESTLAGEIGFSAQAPARALAYAYILDEETPDPVATCDPLRSEVRLGQRVFRLDVPRRCVPKGPLKISVTTVTGFFRSDAGPWSSDRLKVPGEHTLR